MLNIYYDYNYYYNIKAGVVIEIDWVINKQNRKEIKNQFSISETQRLSDTPFYFFLYYLLFLCVNYCYFFYLILLDCGHSEYVIFMVCDL